MKKLLIVVPLFMILACENTYISLNQAIDQMEKAIAMVEKNNDYMTDNDWQILENEMKVPLKIINDAMETDKVNTMEKLRIVSLISKWTAISMNAGINETKI